MARKTTKKETASKGKKPSAAQTKKRLKELWDAAEDLNETLELEPGIDVGVEDPEAMEAAIIDVFELIQAEDMGNLKDTTVATITALAEGAEVELPSAEDADEDEDEDEDEEDEDEDEDEESEDEDEESEDEDEEEKPAKGKKGKAAKGKAGKGKTEEAPAKNKKKEPKGASPYGTAVEIMCTNPDQTRDAFDKAMEKAGFEPKGKHKSAANTGYSAVRGIVAKLRANKKMK